MVWWELQLSGIVSCSRQPNPAQHWMDYQLTSIGTLMALAVIENVIVQVTRPALQGACYRALCIDRLSKTVPL